MTSQPGQYSDDSYRIFVSSVMDYAIIMLDVNGHIISWNEGAQRIKGYEPQEIIGQHFSRFYLPEEIAAGKPDYELKVASEVGRFEDIGWRLRKDGSKFWASVVITALKDPSGELRGFGKVTRDITERKIAEEALLASKRELESLNTALIAARDQAQAASEFKSAFLANMSHEIRTPMNGILGMAELLLRSQLDDNQRRFVNTINEAGNALLSVINDILDFSKIEAGKLVLEVAEFEPIRLVESVGELLTEQARKKNLSLLTFIDPAIPSLFRGDAGRLRQVLMNFAGNAIKFSDKGEVLIRAALEHSDNGRATIRFSVTDNGIGMSEAEQEKLFEPFVQADGSMTRKSGGTGLGLSISKRLVELMNGEIGLHTVKNHGSTFWFKVPLEIVGAPGRRSDPLLTGLARTRVLIVDDEQSSRDILHEYIVSWGLRNGRASNAEEALVLLRSQAADDPYAIAIVDLVMPEMDGLQLAKAVREDEQLRNTKLILMTAFSKPGIGEEAIAVGFDAFLTKPIRQSQLLDCISAIVRKPETISRTSEPVVPKNPSNISRKELILLVEDHPINQEVSLLLLKDCGFEVHVAENGEKALELLQTTPYSLVFMDCQMPVMDGFETTRKIRKMETRTGKHIPIVAMTAHAIEGSKEQCLAAGMDDYLSKPLAPQKLEIILQKWLPLEPARHNATGLESLVDTIEIAAMYGQENVSRLLNLFISEIPKEVAKLKQHVAEGDFNNAFLTNHTLKGVCKSMFAQSMIECCEALELACTNLSKAALEEAFIELETVSERVLNSIKGL
ncbi:MAG: response regulator [Cyanobacteria bacterium SZAS LIN-3]|nr:response regulator [Cyanobacteria bacterium SZAS LIN-3]